MQDVSVGIISELLKKDMKNEKKYMISSLVANSNAHEPIQMR